MSGRVGEGGARIGEGGGRGEIGREELGGGGRDKQGVASITNDLLRGAETPLHQGKGSLVLKSLLRSNKFRFTHKFSIDLPGRLDLTF